MLPGSVLPAPGLNFERSVMQYQMSGVPAPRLVPQPIAPAPPEMSRPSPKEPRSWRWLILLACALAIGAGLFLWRQRAIAKREAASQSVAAIRSAAVRTGTLNRAVRLTGTTGAERYIALVTPQLRGRGDFHRDAKEFSSGQNMNKVVQSSARSSNSSSTSSSTSSASGGTVQSTMGQSNVGSSAFQAATSRLSKSSSASSSASSSSSATSSSAASNPLGSTSDSLFSSTGGGGGNDFMLILQKLAKPGSRVRKGELIAEFDRINMQNRIDDYQSGVAQTEASFKKMKEELEVGRKAHDQTIATAKSELDKARLELKTIPVLSAIQAERTRLAVEEAEARYQQLVAEAQLVDAGMNAQIRNAEIELEQARIYLKRTVANAERMVVHSPIDGLVVVQNTFRGSEFAPIQEGDQLWPGMMFVQVVDTTSMIINAVVNQVDVEKIRIGQSAKVKFDAYPGLELTARIFSIGAITRPGGMRASFVKDVPVRLKLENTDPRVIPDLSVSCDVVVETEANATIAPKAAVFSDDGGKSSFVFVKNGDGWEKRAIETGLGDHLDVVIRQGLRPGETVALDRPPDGKVNV
jgi:HlyD family secretion protein